MAYYGEDVSYATVTYALEMQNVETLKKLLKLLPNAEKATRKAQIVDIIGSYIQSEGLHTLWNKLDELQKAAVAEAVYNTEGQHNAGKFKAKYGKAPNWGERSHWGGGEPSLLALFFYNYALPDDLRDRLKAFVPPPIENTLQTMETLPEVLARSWEFYDYEAKTKETGVEEIPIEQRMMENAALQELPAILRLVQAGKIAVSDKTRQPSAAVMKTIAGILHEGDFYDALEADPEAEFEEKTGPIRAFAWPLLLQGGKIAELSGKKLALTTAGQKALNAPTQDILRAVWQRWAKTTVLDEFRRVHAIKGQTGSGKNGFTALSGRRAAVADALAECPVGKWTHINDFFRYIQAGDHNFLLTRNEWALYIDDPNYGNLGESGTWEILEGRYVLTLLFEYAATLGMIDVAYIPPAGARTDYEDAWGADSLSYLSRYDGLLYFRLNALGAYCLGISEAYSPTQVEAQKFLRVLPNLDVVATETHVPKGDALFLDSFAARISERVWKLDAAKLLAVMEEGRSAAELQAFLEARSEAVLPTTATQFLADYRTRGERLQERGTATLIECSDARLLELIIHDPRTKKHCLPAGDRHFLILPGSDGAFRKALKQLGYVIPRGSGGT